LPFAWTAGREVRAADVLTLARGCDGAAADAAASTTFGPGLLAAGISAASVGGTNGFGARIADRFAWPFGLGFAARVFARPAACVGSSQFLSGAVGATALLLSWAASDRVGFHVAVDESARRGDGWYSVASCAIQPAPVPADWVKLWATAVPVQLKSVARSAMLKNAKVPVRVIG